MSVPMYLLTTDSRLVEEPFPALRLLAEPPTEDSWLSEELEAVKGLGMAFSSSRVAPDLEIILAIEYLVPFGPNSFV